MSPKHVFIFCMPNLQKLTAVTLSLWMRMHLQMEVREQPQVAFLQPHSLYFLSVIVPFIGRELDQAGHT